jgi:hypothetical protein
VDARRERDAAGRAPARAHGGAQLPSSERRADPRDGAHRWARPGGEDAPPRLASATSTSRSTRGRRPAPARRPSTATHGRTAENEARYLPGPSGRRLRLRLGRRADRRLTGAARAFGTPRASALGAGARPLVADPIARFGRVPPSASGWTWWCSSAIRPASRGASAARLEAQS